MSTNQLNRTYLMKNRYVLSRAELYALQLELTYNNHIDVTMLFEGKQLKIEGDILLPIKDDKAIKRELFKKYIDRILELC